MTLPVIVKNRPIPAIIFAFFLKGMKMDLGSTAVIALGGNAIIKQGQKGTITEQFANTRESLAGIVEMARRGWRLAITHGNGPQIGHYLIRVERARDVVPFVPLGVCVAGTEGEMGYMIAQSLQNTLMRENIQREVTAMLTQVVVDPNDPSISDPSKPIGSFFTHYDAQILMGSEGWVMKEDAGRGWRRVVPSPIPQSVVEGAQIRRMVAQGEIVIACGGGGIPVYYMEDGRLEGVDAVVDKDLASAVLAREIGAELLIIATGVPRVCLHFGKPEQMELEHMTVAEAKGYLAAGEFPRGSMGPKIGAAIDFLEGGGKRVIITENDLVLDALEGKAGTEIVG
jgi:carbamate kinase